MATESKGIRVIYDVYTQLHILLTSLMHIYSTNPFKIAHSNRRRSRTKYEKYENYHTDTNTRTEKKLIVSTRRHFHHWFSPAKHTYSCSFRIKRMRIPSAAITHKWSVCALFRNEEVTFLNYQFKSLAPQLDMNVWQPYSFSQFTISFHSHPSHPLPRPTSLVPTSYTIVRWPWHESNYASTSLNRFAHFENEVWLHIVVSVHTN